MFRKLAFGGLVAIGSLIVVTPVKAQSTVRRVDSTHSTARLFVASSKSPDKNINVGVARLNGKVRWNAADPVKSTFDFIMYPADEKEPGQTRSKSANYAILSFKSKHVDPAGNDTVRVTGELTVSDVERIASYDPSESYSGPTYSPAVVHSAKHEATFVFQRAKAGDDTARDLGGDWVATTVVVGEDFPELLSAVSATNWPVYVAEENCTMPSTIGEDFSGPACTGKDVDTLAHTDLQCTTPLTVGEDFAGEVCTGTPLQVASEYSAQNHKAEANQLVADEVKIQLAVRMADHETAWVGASGE